MNYEFLCIYEKMEDAKTVRYRKIYNIFEIKY